jgi:hypothetical protein
MEREQPITVYLAEFLVEHAAALQPAAPDYFLADRE